MQLADVLQLVRSEYQVFRHRKLTGILSPESDPDPAVEERETIYELLRTGECDGLTGGGFFPPEVFCGRVCGCSRAFVPFAGEGWPVPDGGREGCDIPR